jgi:hypothetical protein
MKPENSILKMITKNPAPMAQKKDIAKTTKYRLEVSIIVMEEIVIVMWDGVDDDIPSPTQVGAVPQVSRGSESELDEEIELAATGNAVVGNQSIKYSDRENTRKWVRIYITITMTQDACVPSVNVV